MKMAATLAQKIIAKACGQASVDCGDVVTARVDLAMLHDSGGPRRVKPILERLGVQRQRMRRLRSGGAHP